MIDRKLYEVPITNEGAYVRELRLELFPKAKDERYWNVLKELFESLVEGENEIPFSEADYFCKSNNIEILEFVNAFRDQVVFIDQDYSPQIIRISKEFRFLAEESLESIRVAKGCYNSLRDLKILKNEKDKPYPSFTNKELEQTLRKPNHGPYPNISKRLLDVGLISISSKSKESSGELVIRYAIAINTLENFDDWYKSYTSRLNEIISQNSRKYSVVGIKNKFETRMDDFSLLPDDEAMTGESIRDRKVPITNRYFQEIEINVEKPFCFVLMPFTREYPQVNYRKVIKPYIEENFNLKCYRADDEHSSKKIDDKIYTFILQSKFIIAEVANQNPNVMYELGLAHALDKDVVIIAHEKIHRTRVKNKLPFDINANRVHFYKTSIELKKALQNGISSIFNE